MKLGQARCGAAVRLCAGKVEIAPLARSLEGIKINGPTLRDGFTMGVGDDGWGSFEVVVLEFGDGASTRMPIYEYRCGGCRRRVSLFVRGFVDPPCKACPECGSVELSRLVSRVAVLKSNESQLEDLSDPSAWDGIDENDPKGMADMMRRMGDSMGEDMGPEFGEMVDRMESGDISDEPGDDGDFD